MRFLYAYGSAQAGFSPTKLDTFSVHAFHGLAFDSFKICVLHPTFLPCRIALFFFARILLFGLLKRW
jgi:hypothetical protein